MEREQAIQYFQSKGREIRELFPNRQDQKEVWLAEKTLNAGNNAYQEAWCALSDVRDLNQPIGRYRFAHLRKRIVVSQKDEDSATPSRWSEVADIPELDTSEKRLSALVNIIKNGGQTLTILVMPSDVKQWQSFYQINTELNRVCGKKVIGGQVTKKHLIKTIERVGVAAKSDLDDNQWALTQFGIDIKPALIFAWQRLIDLGLDGTEVFSSYSVGQVGKDDTFITTSPMSRTQILQLLSENGILQAIDFIRVTGLPSKSIHLHLSKLKEVGVVNFDWIDTSEGSFSDYSITQEGQDQVVWPAMRYASRNHLIITFPNRVAEVVRELEALGEVLTISSVQARIIQRYSGVSYSATMVSRALAHFAREGLLQHSEFHRGKMSEISLTSLGESVVNELIKPLEDWCTDKRRVPEIEKLDAQLRVSPNVSAKFCRQVADSYMAKSRTINADFQDKVQKVDELIHTHPALLNQAEVARILDISETTVGRTVQYLLREGRLTRSRSGNKYFLSPKQ